MPALVDCFQRTALILVCALSLSVSWAEDPLLLKDVHAVQAAGSFYAGVQSGSKQFFSKGTVEEGAELWVSDGTSAGTHLVKDINPGPEDSAPIGFVAAKIAGVDVVYFSASTKAEGRELWKSDGTEAGTVLLKDINPGSASSSPAYTVSFPGTSNAYFSADNGSNGRELWKTDGTGAGTSLVVDAYPGANGSEPQYLIVAGVALLWSANDGTHGREPWIYFLAPPAMLQDINPGASSSDPSSFRINFNQTEVYFAANNGTNGTELWKTTGSGASLVKDISAGASSSSPSHFAPLAAGKTLFFVSPGGLSTELWKTDGTNAGTTLVASLGNLYPIPLFTDLYFGLASSGFFSFPDFVGIQSGKMYFSAINLVAQTNEFWTSDGTPAGTIALKTGGVIDISYFFPSLVPPTPLGGSVFFPFNDGVHGEEFWKSGGTPATTSLFTDLNPGQAGFLDAISFNYFQQVSGGATGFIATGPINNVQQFVYSDGTLAGTKVLGSSGLPNRTGSAAPTLLGDLGTQVLFSANDGTLGAELYITNGTTAGTALLKEISSQGSANPNNFIRLSGTNKGVFVAKTPSEGREVWVTDGTSAGTQLLKDIKAGSEGSSPQLLGEVGGKVLFAANDSGINTELWSTDGTTAGTALLKDIFAGASTASPSSAMLMGGKLYFAANSSGIGRELWVSDGTSAGTELVKDIAPGTSDGLDSFSDSMSALGDRVVFAAGDSTTGIELWISDGTSAGTVLLKDIRAGALASYPSYMLAFPETNWVFFEATDGLHGYELWKTDGTTAGTVLVANINTVVDPSDVTHDRGSSPYNFFANNGQLYFAADNGFSGSEVFVLAVDRCLGDVSKTAPGFCGCGAPETDTDGDGKPNCVDACPSDPGKSAVGVCGCGLADLDQNQNGAFECLPIPELRAQIRDFRLLLASLKPGKSAKQRKLAKQKAKAARLALSSLLTFARANKSAVPGKAADFSKLLSTLQGSSKRTLKLAGSYSSDRKATLKALARLNSSLG